MHKQRLLDLADHLEFGKLGHDKFDFSIWSRRANLENSCGTAGCALGECPFLFPNDWKFHNGIANTRRPSYKNNPGALSSAVEFFDITFTEASHLFLPMEQQTWLYGKKLLFDASRKEVADNIRDFVNAKSTPYKALKIFIKTKLNDLIEALS